MSLNPFFVRKLHYLLAVGYTNDIVDTIKTFCSTEVFDEDAVIDDLEDSSDSSILEHLQQKYEWDGEQLCEFHSKLRQALLIEPKPQPIVAKMSSALTGNSVDDGNSYFHACCRQGLGQSSFCAKNIHCRDCQTAICKECGLERGVKNYQCRNCSECQELDVLSQHIAASRSDVGNSSQDGSITKLIASFAMGYIYQCCSSTTRMIDDTVPCAKEIVFLNRYDFEKSLTAYRAQAYYYVVSKYNQFLSQTAPNGHRIRIFCGSPSPCMSAMSKCAKCGILDARNTFHVYMLRELGSRERGILHCDNHERCVFCGKRQQEEGSLNEIVECRSFACDNVMHRKCGNRGICWECCSMEERGMLKKPIVQSSLGVLLYDALIDIIVEYTMGFTVECSNGCGAFIHFKCEWQFKRAIDQNAENIKYYEVNQEYNPLPSVHVYSHALRVFCSACSLHTRKCTRCQAEDTQVSFYGAEVICPNHSKCARCTSAIRYERKCGRCGKAICHDCATNASRYTCMYS